MMHTMIGLRAMERAAELCNQGLTEPAKSESVWAYRFQNGKRLTFSYPLNGPARNGLIEPICPLTGVATT